MLRIPQADIGMRSQGNRWFPGSARVECPCCGRLGSITFPPYDPGVVVRQQCPNTECRTAFHFLVIEGEGSIRRGDWRGELWMHPPARKQRQPKPLDTIDEINAHLREDYEEAVDLFNQRYWRPSAAAAGRVVEGIGRDRTGTDSMLGRLRTELVEHGFTGLAADVLEAINKARNSAAHYDTKANVGEMYAEAMLDLAESVIDLAYLAPRRISLLTHLINGGTGADTEIADIARRAAEMQRVYDSGGMTAMVQWLARKHPQSPAPEESHPDVE